MAESQARVRADRIREKVDLAHLLESYGYDVRSGVDREQQFPCNLHGDGHDLKPSARVYPDSPTWHCFACQLSRDAIATVQAIEGLEFWPAIKFLEEKYGLPALKWDGPQEKGPSTEEVVTSRLSRNVTFSQDLDRLSYQLNQATKERAISMKVSLRYWEAVDKVAWHVLGTRRDGSGPWSESEGKKVLAKLRERLQKAIVEGNA
jgi:DNA primase